MSLKPPSPGVSYNAADLGGPVSGQSTPSNLLLNQLPLDQSKVQITLPSEFKQQEAVNALRNAALNADGSLKDVSLADIKRTMNPAVYMVAKEYLAKNGIQLDESKTLGDVLSTYAKAQGTEAALKLINGIPKDIRDVLIGAAVSTIVSKEFIARGPNAAAVALAKLAKEFGFEPKINLFRNNGKNNQASLDLQVIANPTNPSNPLVANLTADIKNKIAPINYDVSATASLGTNLTQFNPALGIDANETFFPNPADRNSFIQLTQKAAIDRASSSLEIGANEQFRLNPNTNLSLSQLATLSSAVAPSFSASAKFETTFGNNTISAASGIQITSENKFIPNVDISYIRNINSNLNLSFEGSYNKNPNDLRGEFRINYIF